MGKDDPPTVGSARLPWNHPLRLEALKVAQKMHDESGGRYDPYVGSFCDGYIAGYQAAQPKRHRKKGSR